LRWFRSYHASIRSEISRESPSTVAILSLFRKYALLESGIAIPGYVGKEVSLPYKTYEPNDSMILSFA
jgi:hypothetical protein